jgi:hypothetical protein
MMRVCNRIEIAWGMCAARTARILSAPLIRAWPWRLRVLGIRGMIIIMITCPRQRGALLMAPLSTTPHPNPGRDPRLNGI